MTALRLENVARHFGGVVAVADVSLTIEPGQIIGLIGPNGAGKSTVVNLITGILQLTSGRVLLDGHDISRQEAPEVARAGIARTFQTVRLLKDETVLDNVAIGFQVQPRSSLAARLLGLPSAHAEVRQTRDRARAILARFGMSEHARTPAGVLSYGHQRRVEMMRALALSPRILLLDEPVAGMNDVEADALGVIFRELAAEGMGLLLIEHNMRFVMSLCSQIHVLDSGRLIASGGPREIRNDPAVIAAYLGGLSVLEIKDLAAAYDGIVALRGVNLAVAEGQMVALIGPNGAGKSTLLNTVSGLLRASGGSVVFGGEETHRLPAHQIARRGLIQVPEGRQILGPLSVEDNLILGRNARGGRAYGDARKGVEIEDVFALFPILKERSWQTGGSLSGGQQQMLAIGRALMGWPQLLMLDEPSLGLSPLMANQVFEALAKLKGSGQTILLVEQNARRALASTDYAYVIEQGRIVQQGQSAALADDPRIISHYLPKQDAEDSERT